MTNEVHLRPRRSALFMPASNVRAMDKAVHIPADILIFDLEDSVAPAAKDAARAQAVAALESGRYAGREVLVRVNGRATPWHHDDVAALTRARPKGLAATGLVLPKVDLIDDIHAVARDLGDAALPLWAMVETPLGVLNARAIAAAPRMAGLFAGTNDLAKELRARPGADRAPLMASLSMILLAARAAGIAAFDGVYNDIHDVEGFVAVCRQGRAMGFDGKTLIHPDQVDPCHAVFSPTEDEVAYAKALIAAYEAAAQSGKGVAVHKGRMVESLHVDEARRTLAQAGQQPPAKAG